jgi:hypothetical protein
MRCEYERRIELAQDRVQCWPLASVLFKFTFCCNFKMRRYSLYSKLHFNIDVLQKRAADLSCLHFSTDFSLCSPHIGICPPNFANNITYLCYG